MVINLGHFGQDSCATIALRQNRRGFVPSLSLSLALGKLRLRLSLRLSLRQTRSVVVFHPSTVLSSPTTLLGVHLSLTISAVYPSNVCL